MKTIKGKTAATKPKRETVKLLKRHRHGGRWRAKNDEIDVTPRQRERLVRNEVIPGAADSKPAAGKTTGQGD